MNDFVCPRCRMNFAGEPGFFCECAERAPERSAVWNHPEHGMSRLQPCAAVCHRCGWSGEMPARRRPMPEWMSKAIDAGWKPPKPPPPTPRDAP